MISLNSSSVQSGFNDSYNLFNVSRTAGTGRRGRDLWQLYNDGLYPLISFTAPHHILVAIE